MCRAYRTVSLNSALLLTGTLPLDLRVREAASLYKAKKGAQIPELCDREIEIMTPANETPHPSQKIKISIGSLVNEEQYAQHSNYAVRIFTDGSKVGGRVGAAISVWKGEAEIKAHKLVLSSYCTVYQAELLALTKATKMVHNQNGSIGIYSDSRAALETIANTNSTHPLAVEARQHIRNGKLQNKEISLFWIKAHNGMEGNERADALAKEATLNTKKRPDYDMCPVSYIKRSIRTETTKEWNARYRKEETATTTKMFFPDAIVANRTIKKLKIDPILTQLFTGHGG